VTLPAVVFSFPAISAAASVVRLARCRTSLATTANRGDLALRGNSDVGDEAGNIRAGTNNQGLTDLAFTAADLRVLQLFRNGDADLLKGSQRFLRGTRRFFCTGRDLSARALEFLGGGCCLSNARSQLSGGGRNALGGLLLFGERSRLFALRFRFAGGDN
jgi:hypothetical protein